ncbi:uncharacterized protein LOC131662272 isoform X2 [Vicia villosa]|uniref:uncharacterized protein LOC131662272 isoform X2 n=1 Tax=Vicia villosa TaxID=3911 RepID=UPI00273CBE0C|nr:uncharacterized protein LOC131662272 isoform X2 [Vicia villosa]
MIRLGAKMLSSSKDSKITAIESIQVLLKKLQGLRTNGYAPTARSFQQSHGPVAIFKFCPGFIIFLAPPLDEGEYFNNTREDSSVLFHVKEDHNGAEPSGNSVSAINLIRCFFGYHQKDC